MAYRLQPGEPIKAGIRRVGLEQIDRAAAELKSIGRHAVAVHETRKVMKRLRALLRLVRPSIAKHQYARENERFRDMARLLAHAREQHVLSQTLTSIAPAGGTARVTSAIDASRDAIAAAPVHDAGENDGATLRAALAEARDDWAHLAISGHGFSILARGLEQCYASGRKMARTDHMRLDDEGYHEWRKVVQQHWRHMALLSLVWPSAMAARVAVARDLSQNLGDDHDLAMLRDFARAHLSGADLDVIDRLTRQRQSVLRDIARPLGLMLYAETPRALVKRMEIYWAAAADRPEHVEKALRDTRQEPTATPPAAVKRQPARQTARKPKL